MATIPTTYKSDTWERIRVQLVYAFDAANGRVNVEGNFYPRLTNAQALAVLQAWRKLLVAWKQPTTALFPEVWYFALGRYRDGDKFDLTTAHGAAPAPDIVVAGTWEFAAHAAERLDGVKAQPLLLVLNFSYSGYKEAARDAYSVLKKSKAKTKVPMPPGVDPPDVDPPAPPVEPPPPPQLPSVDKAGLVLVLLLVIALAARRRN